jgi:hypothetical protein
LNKYTTARSFADPDTAARKLVEIASTIEPVQDGRIYIELLNGLFLFRWRQADGVRSRHQEGHRARMAHDA